MKVIRNKRHTLNNFETLLNKIIKVVLLFLVVAAYIDPVGKLTIRYISLAALLLLATLLIIKYKHPKSIYMITGVVLLLNTYGLFLWSYNGAQFLQDTSYFAGSIFILVTFLIRNKSIENFSKEVLFYSAVAGSLFQIILYQYVVGDYTKEYYFESLSIAIMGFRNYSGFETPYIYLLASPLIAVGMAIGVADRRNIALITILFVGMLLSGTRMSWFIGGFLFVYYLVRYLRIQKGMSRYLVYFTIMAIIVVTSYVIFESWLATLKTGSIEAKFSDFFLYFQLPVFELIIGQGFNAFEWSPITKELVGDGSATRTELTYLEIIRVFGIIGAGAWVFIFWYLWRRSSCKLAAFVVFLQSTQNPYLFSSNGMLPLNMLLSNNSKKTEHEL